MHRSGGDTSARAPETQAAGAVLMIRPQNFGSNAETAATNFFQKAASLPDGALRAQREFDGLALALASAGIRVYQFNGQTKPALPDEVFPNNWLSLHADGTAVLYPLLAENRRRERRPEILAALQREQGRKFERIVDLTKLESRGEYLEGTGSLVLDRERRVAYAALSPRTHPNALAEFGRVLGYEIVAFTAVDRAGRPIYHTNVLLSLGTRFAALCTSAISDARERGAVSDRIESSGRELIDLSIDELEGFAGNLLELHGREGPVIVLSAGALASLADGTRRALARHGRLVTADVGTIERIGGGSVRCMLAEVPLSRSFSP